MEYIKKKFGKENTLSKEINEMMDMKKEMKKEGYSPTKDLLLKAKRKKLKKKGINIG